MTVVQTPEFRAAQAAIAQNLVDDETADALESYLTAMQWHAARGAFRRAEVELVALRERLCSLGLM